MIDRSTIEGRVIHVVADQFGADEDGVTRETSFVDDLAADSLDVTELTMELEEEFSIRIPDDEADKLHTVGQTIDYISSVPIEAAQKLTYEVAKAQQSGARPATIAKMMRKRFPELVRSRVNLISRTETAKASSALTQARCERLNIDWYVWESSKDQRTRQSHKKMHGVVVPWSQAPSPEELIGEKSQGHYQCGEIYNCRCTPLVVLTLADIAFPARVYWNGHIKQMTKQDFKKIAVGMEELETA